MDPIGFGIFAGLAIGGLSITADITTKAIKTVVTEVFSGFPSIREWISSVWKIEIDPNSADIKKVLYLKDAFVRIGAPEKVATPIAVFVAYWVENPSTTGGPLDPAATPQELQDWLIPIWSEMTLFKDLGPTPAKVKIELYKFPFNGFDFIKSYYLSLVI